MRGVPMDLDRRARLVEKRRLAQLRRERAGVEAGLRLRARDLAGHAALVLEDVYQAVWIVAAGGGPWLVELSFRDREVCSTPSMPLFVGSR
jgi:hypothetical protein